MPKLLIFDWDDVFTLGSKEGYFACYRKAYTAVGETMTLEEEYERILSRWGKHHTEELRALLVQHPDKVDEAAALYEKELFGNTFISHLSLVSGSIELITALAKEYTLAVATGMHPQILREKVFPKFSIPDVFDTIITTYDIDDIEKQKPHPYMVEHLLEVNGVDPPDALVIGDGVGDMRMARGAGVEGVAVLTGQMNKEDAEALGVRYIIPNVTHLTDILQTL